jgi:hypothetical protein
VVVGREEDTDQAADQQQREQDHRQRAEPPSAIFGSSRSQPPSAIRTTPNIVTESLSLARSR